MPKLAQILEQPNSTQQVCLFFVFTVNICIKQKDSILLTWVCSVMRLDHRGHQNNGQNISDTLACGLCAAFCFYHILMTCVIYYYLNRRMATWNLFVKHFQTMWFNLSSTCTSGCEISVWLCDWWENRRQLWLHNGRWNGKISSHVSNRTWTFWWDE